MKFKTKSLGFKLWLYFTLFSGIILLILWLLQIVFLSNFYEGMKTKGVMKVASEIESKYGQSDFESTIDQLTFKNSVMVFITDTEGNIEYFSDEHDFGKRRATRLVPWAASDLRSCPFRSVGALVFQPDATEMS